MGHFLLLPLLTICFIPFLIGAVTPLLQASWAFPYDLSEELFFSVKVAALSSFLSCFAGLTLCSAVFLLPKRRNYNAILKFFASFPHLSFAYLFALLVSDSGLVQRALDLRFKEISLSYDENGLGVIIAYVLRETPFVFLMLLPVFERKLNGLKEVAMALGAGPVKVFKSIFLPLSLQHLGACFCLIFSFTMGAYEFPALLGPSYPKMISVEALELFFSVDTADNQMAINLGPWVLLISLIPPVLFLMSKVRKGGKL